VQYLTKTAMELPSAGDNTRSTVWYGKCRFIQRYYHDSL